MVNRKTVSALTIAALLACAVPVKSMATGLLMPVIGQTTPKFSVPASVAKGTEITISSSSDNMNAISEALGQGFEGEYENSKVSIENKEADAAIQDVLKGNANLAAISRPLTAKEKEQGLIEIPVSRSKIAIVVDQSNPFAQSITGDQFARIFRGEIKNWSEVGGPSAEIKLVDRPATSETRQALAPYPVFQGAEFKAAANAATLTEDTSEAVAKALGANGIGYVLVDELESNPSLKPLNLHQTPPTEPAYPFSQPYSFVYAGGASPEVSAFLGYATGNPGQGVINSANVSGIGILPEATASNSTGNTATGATGATAEGTPENASGDASADSPDADAEASNALDPAGPDGELGTADDIEALDPAGPDGELGTADDIEVLTDTAGPDGELGTADDIDVTDESTETGGLGALAGRGSWWWLLLPLAGLGLLIWAAGKRGSEEETGYSVNADRDDNISGNYGSTQAGGRGGAKIHNSYHFF